jgi:hypothetical protein
LAQAILYGYLKATPCGYLEERAVPHPIYCIQPTEPRIHNFLDLT